MARITNFFAGANSGEGFQNLFHEMVDLEATYDVMILKGGPGVGKNTFMREIGRTMEQAGTPVEYLWCSGDPDSLDGVVLPEVRCAVVDGTSPHDTAPLGHPAKKVGICKGLRDRLLDGTSTWRSYLGHFCRTSYLIRGVTAQKKFFRIRKIQRKIKSTFLSSVFIRKRRVNEGLPIENACASRVGNQTIQVWYSRRNSNPYTITYNGF